MTTLPWSLHSKLPGRCILLEVFCVSYTDLLELTGTNTCTVFALPWLVLYKLNMRKRVKIGVYCVFLLGIIDIAFSLTRFLTIQLTVVGDFRSITTIGELYHLASESHLTRHRTLERTRCLHRPHHCLPSSSAAISP